MVQVPQRMKARQPKTSFVGSLNIRNRRTHNPAERVERNGLSPPVLSIRVSVALQPMEGADRVAPPDSNGFETFEDEMQEDILMLKAHMGHFDHLLSDERPETHLFEPSPVRTRISRMELLRSPMVAATPTKIDLTKDEESSDEEDFEKGSSKKRKAPTKKSEVAYDSDSSQEEEDVEEMKMRKNVEEETEEREQGEMSPPPAKRPATTFLSPHEHHPLSLSAPSTPLPSMQVKPLLANNGRYYDDVHSHTVERKCRFCMRASGLAFRAPPAQRCNCFVCGGDHMARDCPNVLCYNCWAIGHRAQSCKQPRGPRPSCFRCHGVHDATDCPTLNGIKRLGSQESFDILTNLINLDRDDRKGTPKSKRSTVDVSLPHFCCNCGLSGHAARDCRMLDMDSTHDEVERNSHSWFDRASSDVKRARSASFKASSSSSKSRDRDHLDSHHHHHHHHHHNSSDHRHHHKDQSIKRSVSLPGTPVDSRRDSRDNRDYRDHRDSRDSRDHSRDSKDNRRDHSRDSRDGGGGGGGSNRRNDRKDYRDSRDSKSSSSGSWSKDKKKYTSKKPSTPQHKTPERRVVQVVR